MLSPVLGAGSFLGRIEGTAWDADNVVRTDPLTDWQFGAVIAELEGLARVAAGRNRMEPVKESFRKEAV